MVALFRYISFILCIEFPTDPSGPLVPLGPLEPLVKVFRGCLPEESSGVADDLISFELEVVTRLCDSLFDGLC